jgi:YbgC/YbaW family acyl-CoA thioester hydrolase
MHRFDKQALLSVAPTRFSHIRPVLFQDVDAAGIIFYPVVLSYCHDLYVEFLAANDTPLPQVLQQRAWAAPIRHAEADYLRPFEFGDSVEVCLVRAHLQASEVTLGFNVLLEGTNDVAAVAQTVHTFVRLPDFKRMRIPERLATAFQTLES